MTVKAYRRTALTGGGAALDGIDGANLSGGEIAFVKLSGIEYDYILDATSGLTESSPYRIVPNSNPGTKVWILQSSVFVPEAITVTYTGTPVYPFKCNVVQPEGVQIDSTLYTASGKWVLTFGDYVNGPSFYLDGYTTLSFPDLVGVRNDFYFSYSASDTIEELVADVLVVIGGSYYVYNYALLTTNSQADLTTIGGNYELSDNDALATNSQDALTTIGGNYSVYNNALLTTNSHDALTTIGGNYLVNNNSLLTTNSQDALTTIGGNCELYDLPAIVSITLPAIVSIGGAISATTGVAAITTFTLGSGLLSVGGNVTITSPTLAEASVNNTLVRLAALDGTGGTTLYTGFIVDVSGNCAPPSATGLAARLTLIAASNTVSVNGNFAITASDPSNPYTFTVAGDKTTIFVAGTVFTVTGSTGNDGTYTVVSSAFGAATVITVTEVVASAVGDGTIGKITG
jgi:hypothetical protein